jgi:thiosulfate reductase cytochrome b subunit
MNNPAKVEITEEATDIASGVAPSGSVLAESEPRIEAPTIAEVSAVRHSALVRVTHWLTTLAFLALLISGIEIVFSHPRFYWGETGNLHTSALFKFPVPTSRGTFPNGYAYKLPDQNGWSRYLHFQAAWLLVLTGFLYLAYGFWRGHFRKNLVPDPSDLSPGQLGNKIASSLRLERPGGDETWSYNAVQRLTYLVVIFVLFPVMIWTGLAMSPGFVSAFPALVRFWGGQESARTIHFFVTGFLVAFLVVHLSMVVLAGFRERMRAMITGRAPKREEA